MRQALEAIPDDEVRRILYSVAPLVTMSYQQSPWGWLAARIFCVGSTSAYALCRRAGLDPDRPIKDRK